jgi:hypothetical protein
MKTEVARFPKRRLRSTRLPVFLGTAVSERTQNKAAAAPRPVCLSSVPAPPLDDTTRVNTEL